VLDFSPAVEEIRKYLVISFYSCFNHLKFKGSRARKFLSSSPNLAISFHVHVLLFQLGLLLGIDLAQEVASLLPCPQASPASHMVFLVIFITAP
jgi:hypothetical protein